MQRSPVETEGYCRCQREGYCRRQSTVPASRWREHEDRADPAPNVDILLEGSEMNGSRNRTDLGEVKKQGAEATTAFRTWSPKVRESFHTLPNPPPSVNSIQDLDNLAVSAPAEVRHPCLLRHKTMPLRSPDPWLSAALLPSRLSGTRPTFTTHPF